MRSIKSEIFVVFEEKKSKFLTYLKPVSTKEEAVEFIEKISSKNRDATHNVYAYTVNDGTEHVKYSDDGEPKDTAGKPAYEILRMRDIGNVAVVISRYFGGVKLGAGGLIRAYAGAVKMALDSSEICEIIPKMAIVIDAPYNKADVIEKILSEENCGAVAVEYGETVVFRGTITANAYKKIKEIDNIVVMI